MTEQEKRDKALRILEGHYSNYILRYDGDLVTMKEIIDLLKAQEPMVLDFGDIQTMSNVDVFFEERSSTLVYPLMLIGVENGNKSQNAFFIPMTVKPLREYGKSWRCWTSRPTDEQREATPWIS